jgi:hypothetical protein
MDHTMMGNGLPTRVCFEEIFMSIWKIRIYRNKHDQNSMCCTVVARGDTSKDAEQLAEKDHVKNFPDLSKSPCAESCGPASNSEAKMLEEGESVKLIGYVSLHENDGGV